MANAVTPSGILLFGRAIKLIVAPPVPKTFKVSPTQNAMVITDLRVQFKITKSLRKEPNTSEITIYNLNPTSRGQLQGKGARCWLEAGYAGAMAGVFSGDVRYIDHRKDDAGCNWLTKLELGDGERAYRHGRVNVSFKAGTPRADVVKALAAQCGWDLGNVTSVLPDIVGQCAQGYGAYGPAWKALDETLNPIGLTWSIKDNALQILPKAGYVPGTATLIDGDHGLIGSPSAGTPAHKGKPQVLKVKALMQPGLDPGQRINLQAEHYKGVYVIQKAEYAGDTHEKPWQVDMEVNV